MALCLLLDELSKLERFAPDPAFREKWRHVKQDNKIDLAQFIERVTKISVDPASLFDVQVKRIHEYKRQHLNLLHVVTLYNRFKRNPSLDITPRTVIFGGKAAPGYFMAKLIIKLANSVAETVDHDPDIRGRQCANAIRRGTNTSLRYSHRCGPARSCSCALTAKKGN